jgi:hypothetical protein
MKNCEGDVADKNGMDINEWWKYFPKIGDLSTTLPVLSVFTVSA